MYKEGGLYKGKLFENNPTKNLWESWLFNKMVYQNFVSPVRNIPFCNILRGYIINIRNVEIKL